MVYIMEIELNKELGNHEQKIGKLWSIRPIVTLNLLNVIMVLHHNDEIYQMLTNIPVWCINIK